MKERKTSDLAILANPDMGVSEMMAWTKELFTGVGTLEFRIPGELLEFGFKLMKNHFEGAESREIRRMILIKVLHTREVVVAGNEIMALENEKSGILGWSERSPLPMTLDGFRRQDSVVFPILKPVLITQRLEPRFSWQKNGLS